jgi:hypothetical protein
LHFHWNVKGNDKYTGYIVRKYQIYSWKSEYLASFSGLFHSKCKLSIFLRTTYLYCGYPSISKSKKQILLIRAMLSLTRPCYHILSITLHESGTRKDLLGPWLNKTNVYLTPLSVLKITQLHDKHDIPPEHIILVLSQPVFALTH